MSRSQQQFSWLEPPAWLQGFRSEDLDEVCAYTARWSGEHSRVAQRAGPLGFESAVLNSDTCAVAWSKADLPLTIRGWNQPPLLHLGPGAGRYRLGRREHVIGPQDAMFVAEGWEFTRHSHPSRTLAIAPHADRLLEEIAARAAARPGRQMLTSRQLTISDDDRLRLASALESLAHASAPGAEAGLAQRADAQLLGVIADLLLQGSAVTPARRGMSARTADLEDWIEANLELPITAGQLCRVAGVSQRGLEKIFESRRGMSPMRFVAERRLAAAHRALVRAGEYDDVTTIATRVGFSHMGRFASSYRQAFGESPSQTLKRVRRARACTRRSSSTTG